MNNSSPHLIPKVVKLEQDIKDRLDHLAEIKHRSVHWLMKEAISRYLNNEEYNERLKKETLQAWEEVQAGKVVSHDAISTWLDTWGEDDEGDAPK